MVLRISSVRPTTLSSRPSRASCVIASARSARSRPPPGTRLSGLTHALPSAAEKGDPGFCFEAEEKRWSEESGGRERGHESRALLPRGRQRQSIERGQRGRGGRG
eukprot:scaffold33233_cov31-Tisochrysis_lutea.AAC.1